MCGGCGRGDGLGPERAASDALREPEPSLLWRCRSLCNCAAKSGPRYCDSNTVRRFSYLCGWLAHAAVAARAESTKQRLYGPLLCNVAFLELVLQLVQLGLQLRVGLGHGIWGSGSGSGGGGGGGGDAAGRCSGTVCRTNWTRMLCGGPRHVTTRMRSADSQCCEHPEEGARRRRRDGRGRRGGSGGGIMVERMEAHTLAWPRYAVGTRQVRHRYAQGQTRLHYTGQLS